MAGALRETVRERQGWGSERDCERETVRERDSERETVRVRETWLGL